MENLKTCFCCEGRGGIMFMFIDGPHSVPCHVCEGRGIIGEGFMKRPVIYDKNLKNYKISAEIMKGSKL